MTAGFASGLCVSPLAVHKAIGHERRFGTGWLGTAYGVAAVLGWAGFNVGSAAALQHGFQPNDLTMLRYGVSALICAPWLIRVGLGTLGGLGWWRGILLALAAGPMFGALVNVAMLYTPLSHTATVVPAVSMLGGMVTGRLLLGERVSTARWAGAGVMTVGLAMLMLQGTHDGASPDVWIGDLLFIVAGALWTSYTFMLRRWGAEPVLAVSAVNVISGIAYFPIYLFLTHGQFPHVGWITFGQVALVQGVIAAFFTVYAYAQCVRFLGVTHAAVFPALVAPVALLLGAILLGNFPTFQQEAAVAISITGLIAAIGLWPRQAGR